MRKFLVVVAAAVLLGMVSPFMAAADDGLILQAWFQWLPVQVDQLVLPNRAASAASALSRVGLALK